MKCLLVFLCYTKLVLYCQCFGIVFFTAELINCCICDFVCVLRYLRHWNHSLLLREKVISLLVLLSSPTLKKSVERLLPLLFLQNAVDKDRETNYLV